MAQDDLTLQADQLPASVFGFFLTSRTQGFVMNPAGSLGNLCLGGAIGRYSQQAMSSGAAGRISLELDLVQIPTPSGPVPVVPGDTWNFTLWYRGLHPGSNFTDGLEILFD